MRLEILGFCGHEVGAVKRDDSLATLHVVPERDACLLDSTLHARDDGRDTAIVVSDLPRCFEDPRHLDVLHLHHRQTRDVVGIELDQLDALLPNESHYGSSFGDWSGATGRIAVASAERNRGGDCGERDQIESAGAHYRWDTSSPGPVAPQ